MLDLPQPSQHVVAREDTFSAWPTGFLWGAQWIIVTAAATAAAAAAAGAGAGAAAAT